MGIFGRKVDLLDKYEKKLEDLEDNVRMEQSSLTGKVVLFCLFINFSLRDLIYKNDFSGLPFCFLQRFFFCPIIKENLCMVINLDTL